MRKIQFFTDKKSIEENILYFHTKTEISSEKKSAIDPTIHFSVRANNLVPFLGHFRDISGPFSGDCFDIYIKSGSLFKNFYKWPRNGP